MASSGVGYLFLLLATCFVTSALASPCQSNPCMYGICLDEQKSNNSYSCYCIDGYTGINCEINWDDCWSDPCLNGATCNDEVAAYNCSCTENFIGINCEERYNECLYTPCLNNGTCVEYNGFTCQCLEGYSGDYCEIDAAVCNNTICKNFGECVEGRGLSFSCRCAEGWKGELCEEDLDECVESPCQNGGLCINVPGTYTCACLFGFTGKNCDKPVIPCKTNPCQNEAICLSEDDQSVCYCVPDYHGPLCEWRYDECRSNHATCSNGGSCVDGINSFTCSCAENYSGDNCTEYNPVPTSTTPRDTEWPEASSVSPSMPVSTFGTPEFFSSPESTTLRIEDTVTSEIFPTSPRVPDDSTPLETVSEALSSLVTTPVSSTDPITVQPVLTDSSYSAFPSQVTQPATHVSSETIEIEPTSFTLVPFGNNTPTTRSYVPDPENITTIHPNGIATRFVTGDPITLSPSSQLPGTSPTFSTSEGTVLPQNSPVPVITSTERDTSSNCTQQPCINVTCPINSTQCNCNYQEECTSAREISNAAFNGKSYLRQEISVGDDGKVEVLVRTKTQAKNGIVLHAFFDDERYILLHMESGQLKFQFSCGLQTMLLGEIDSPINNGQDVDILTKFQYTNVMETDKCLATLLLNDTVVMSGEQVVTKHDNLPREVKLHLGGLPPTFSHYFPHVATGFVGCVSLFKINGVRKRFVRDSDDAYQIEECTSFLCLSNPCQNFGACLETNGRVKCTCLAGYKGESCERSACDDNPCRSGASCVNSPGVGFTCICPLGTHGLLCEEETRIMQASFSVFSPGISSYIAYGLTGSIKDSFEIKFRLMPRSIEQISLVAFLGQSGPYRLLSDHFAVTYVRGYVMLTWDLGSGARRIFTTTPLTAKMHRPHTLRVGRRGRDAWLSVDGIGNVTGRSAGSMTRLDVAPILYVGGHKAINFETLPHDLPLHTGFNGCIYDVEIRMDNKFFPVATTNSATGRGVGECHRNECTSRSCKNGGVCLNHGPTYSCVCGKDWEGADCSKPMSF